MDGTRGSMDTVPDGDLHLKEEEMTGEAPSLAGMPTGVTIMRATTKMVDIDTGVMEIEVIAAAGYDTIGEARSALGEKKALTGEEPEAWR